MREKAGIITSIMKKVLFFILFFSGLSLFSEDADLIAGELPRSIEGIVYLDLNKNGVRDRGEKGVESAVVSDGFSVVKSDKNGRFKITPHERARFVTLSTPSGYKHISDFYLSVDETAFEFGIVATESSSGFFVHYSDPEERVYRDWIENIKDFIAANNPAFLTISGDICYEKGLRMHNEFVTDKTMGCRVVYSIGNHDLLKGYTDRNGNPYGEKLFEEMLGPVWYSFNVDGVHFVTIPMLSGDAVPSYSADDVISWFKRDLDAVGTDVPTYIISHSFIANNPELEIRGKRDTLSLTDYNIRGYFHGHEHTAFHRELNENTLLYCSGPPDKGGRDHTPSSFRVVDFSDKNKVTTELRYNDIKDHIVSTHFTDGDSLRVSAVIYDSRYYTLDAEVEIGDKRYKLHPSLDLNGMIWETSIPLTQVDNSLAIYYIHATFNNGSSLSKRISFDQNFNLLWAKALPAINMYTTPLIVGDMIILGGLDENNGDRSGIYAIDKESGSLLWYCKTENSIRHNVVSDGSYLYACDVNYNVYSISLKDGEVKWSVDLKDDGRIASKYCDGLAIDSGMLFLGVGSRFMALNCIDGERVWINDQWTGGTPGIAANVVYDGVVITSPYWKGRIAHDIYTGQMLWQKTDDLNRMCNNTPIVADGHFLFANQKSITEVDPRSGEVIREKRFNYWFDTKSKPIIEEGLIIFGTGDRGVMAFQRDDFSEVWNFKVNPSLIYTPPYLKSFEMTVETTVLRCKDYVLFGANDGYIYCLDLKSGSFVNRFNVGLPVLADLVTDGESIYAVDFAGRVLRFTIL